MMKVPAQKFEKILKLVWFHLSVANASLGIWEELRSTPERQNLCATYHDFFSWTQDALVDRFIHKVGVVTDTDKSQPSIYKLANMIQAHPNLAPGICCQNVCQRLDNHAQVLKEIRGVRNRRSSHWDLNKTPPEPNLKQCRELLKELHSLLEDIWNAHKPNPYGGRSYYPLPNGQHATSYVLNTLTKTLPK